MRQAVTLITLGVADVDAARAFYERLGWSPGLVTQGTVFFEANGLVVSLWSRELLAADSEVVDTGGWGGITLAHNVASKEDVDTVIEEARAAGATIAREPGEVFWGGYTGIFHDPDGHAWEVAWNPSFPLDERGMRLPASS